MAIDFNKEKAKRTGENMFVGCPDCQTDNWGVVVRNLGNIIQIRNIVCYNCGGECEVANGILL